MAEGESEDDYEMKEISDFENTNRIRSFQGHEYHQLQAIPTIAFQHYQKL